jgi:ribonuclease HI
MITIFTDGSSRGNPGPGGWGAILIREGVSDVGSANIEEVTELGGHEPHTTNNRMELTAALKALTHTHIALPTPLPTSTVRKNKNDKKSHTTTSVKVHSDSSYVINGITKWVYTWQQKNWVTSQKEEVLNRDLWEALLIQVKHIQKNGSTISWNYVGGHVGVVGNERCDEIATAFADNETPELYSGSLAGYSIKNILDVSVNTDSQKEKKSSRSHSRAVAYSYVSMVNRKVETHATWKECEARVKGAKGAKFKKAISKAAEAALISDFSKR